MKEVGNRRDFLFESAFGFGGMALASMMLSDGNLVSGQEPGSDRVSRGVLHNPPKAKRVVQVVHAGAASQLDTFDYKPELVRLHGQPSILVRKSKPFRMGSALDEISI